MGVLRHCASQLAHKRWGNRKFKKLGKSIAAKKLRRSVAARSAARAAPGGNRVSGVSRSGRVRRRRDFLGR